MTPVNLPATGRKLTEWDLTGLPDDVSAVRLLIDGEDVGQVDVTDPAAGTVQALLAGPDVDVDAYPHPAGTIVLTAGWHEVSVLIPDTPEVEVVGGGAVVVE